MSDDPELKPCPFCGGEAELSCGFYNAVDYATVMCTDCGAKICFDSDHDPELTFDAMEEAAIRDWNRRVQ